MKPIFFPLLVGCLLLVAACVQPATAGIPVTSSTDVPAQPTLIEAATETATETATPAPTVMADPAATATEATPSPVVESGEKEPAVASPGEAMAVDEDLLELGKEVYRHQACGVCHLLASVGTLGTFGPPHDDLATIAAERIHEERYKGTTTTAEEYIRESIVDPQAFFVEGYLITRFPMPVFTNLSEQQVDALVYLLMQPPAVTP